MWQGACGYVSPQSLIVCRRAFHIPQTHGSQRAPVEMARQVICVHRQYVSESHIELVTVSSSTDAAHSITSPAVDPSDSRTADLSDDRHAADSNEYAEIEWSRSFLRGYIRSEPSALKISSIWDYVWRIDNKDGKEYWLCQECHQRKTIGTICTAPAIRPQGEQHISRTYMVGSRRVSLTASSTTKLLLSRS